MKIESNKENCVICEKECDSSKLWKSSNHPWMKICEICWELPFDEKHKKVREYAKKNNIPELEKSDLSQKDINRLIKENYSLRNELNKSLIRETELIKSSIKEMMKKFNDVSVRKVLERRRKEEE